MQLTPTSITEKINQKINQLQTLEGQRDRKAKTIQRQIDALYEKLAAKLDDLPERISALENDIKQDCLILGTSLITDDLAYDVIWSAGRETWDSKALAGYAAAHPEIEQFRKQGKPSARLKRKK